MAAPNWSNQTIWTADNLDVLRGMNSASVDLVYLDPPFNSKRNYAAPIGSEAAGAAFKDTWTLSDLDEAWHNEVADRDLPLYKAIEASSYTHGDGMKSYLIMMALRLLELRRVLKETGSIYLHCDATASHYLKVLMDAIFGTDNFRNEIAWCYAPSGRAPKYGFHRKHDTILYYSTGDEPVFFHQYTPMNPKTLKTYNSTDADGRMYKEAPGGRSYLDEQKGRPIPSWWADIPSFGTATNSPERMGYPTQKPLALLDRIIMASSKPGDIVLDPFCGCATALVAAERLERQWVGIDISPKAADLVRTRLRETQGIGMLWRGGHRTDIPRRTDLGPAPPMRESRVQLYGEQGGDCKGCGTHFEPQHLTVDHIIPVARGGTDHIENLQLLCGHCNSVKGDRPMEYLRARLARSAA